VKDVRDYRQLIHTYFGLKIPPIKIAVTGSGRVAHGILEIMNLMGIHEVEPFDYLHKSYQYPVYVHLKGRDLYERKDDGTYNRQNFHEHPTEYKCSFAPFIKQTDILMNGVYWDKEIAPLFTLEEFQSADFKIQTIADITNDESGSVPVNKGDSTIDDPVYGVDKTSLNKTAPYQPNSVDIIAVGNLPNELPRDASRYFGEQLIKYILEDLAKGSAPIIERATILKNGKLTTPYQYLEAYAK
jgi:saccharopine dehydrogenase (NAD+, L-lysine-forming)